MIRRLTPFGVALAAATALWGVAAAVPGAAPLAASHAVLAGSWTIKFDDGTSRRICIEDIQPFIQLAHAGPACTRLVIEDAPDRATVQYSCPGTGWGRTSIRVETPRLATISSQGIANRAPFAFEAEARRTGDCQPPSPHRPE